MSEAHGIKILFGNSKCDTFKVQINYILLFFVSDLVLETYWNIRSRWGGGTQIQEGQT